MRKIAMGLAGSALAALGRAVNQVAVGNVDQGVMAVDPVLRKEPRVIPGRGQPKMYGIKTGKLVHRDDKPYRIRSGNPYEVRKDVLDRVIKATIGAKDAENMHTSVAKLVGLPPEGVQKIANRLDRWVRNNPDHRMPGHIREKASFLAYYSAAMNLRFPGSIKEKTA